MLDKYPNVRFTLKLAGVCSLLLAANVWGYKEGVERTYLHAYNEGYQDHKRLEERVNRIMKDAHLCEWMDFKQKEFSCSKTRVYKSGPRPRNT